MHSHLIITIGCPEKDVTVKASVKHSAINAVEGL